MFQPSLELGVRKKEDQREKFSPQNQNYIFGTHLKKGFKTFHHDMIQPLHNTKYVRFVRKYDTFERMIQKFHSCSCWRLLPNGSDGCQRIWTQKVFFS